MFSSFWETMSTNFDYGFYFYRCWWYRLHCMFICKLGGVDHNNLRDIVYKYVWLLYIHIKLTMIWVQGRESAGIFIYPTQVLYFLWVYNTKVYLFCKINKLHRVKQIVQRHNLFFVSSSTFFLLLIPRPFRSRRQKTLSDNQHANLQYHFWILFLIRR